MQITIGENTKHFMSVLEIPTYPFTEGEIKSNFRKKAKKTHPDNGGTNEAFDEVRKAYNHLKNLAIPDSKIESNGKIVLPDLDLAEDEIADTCPSCRGRKVEDYQGWIFETCDNCGGTGLYVLKCKFCDHGKFITRSGNEVPCRSCNGTGEWKKVFCKVCNTSELDYQRRMWNYSYDIPPVGKIKRYISTERPCSTCFGYGQIKVKQFNPVIRKGAILKGK